MNITPHFSLDEFIVSRHDINNKPPHTLIATLLRTAQGMEKVRTILGCPITISSGYRSPELNSRVGGSANSQHCKGEAVDFVALAFGNSTAICRAIINSPTLTFDQLIDEGTWVHISFAQVMRREVLTMRNGKYSKGLTA